MSFLPGYGIRAYLNEKSVSAYISGVTVSHSRALSDVTVATTSGGTSFVPGLKSGTFTVRGPHDNDPAAGLNAEISAAIGVDNSIVATFLPDGDAVGKPALFCLGDPSDWGVDASVAEAVGLTFGTMADDSVDMGYVLLPASSRTADANGTAVDRGTVSTPSTGGLAAVLHVTAYSGLTSAAYKIQHSADNSSWSDLVSFTTATGTTSERVTVAGGTTVNRYLRAVIDVTGTGSVTALIAAAPR